VKSEELSVCECRDSHSSSGWGLYELCFPILWDSPLASPWERLKSSGVGAGSEETQQQSHAGRVD